MDSGKYWEELLSDLKETFSEYENVSMPDDIVDIIRNLKAEKSTLEDAKNQYRKKLKQKEEEIRTLRSDIETSPVSSTSADDNEALMKTIEMNKQDIAKLTQENESLKSFLTKISQENESLKSLKESDNKEYFQHFQKRFNDVAQQRDEAILQGAAKDERIRHLDEMVNELRQEIDSLENQISDYREENGSTRDSRLEKAFRDTFKVVLKRDENSGKFGVSFGIKKGVIPRITESRVVVCKVDHKMLQTRKIRENDFVLEINDHNTQLASMDDVRFNCGNTNSELHLTLRRAIDPREIDISGNKDNSADYKLGVGLFFKNVIADGYGHSIGICDNDEIIQINGKDPNLLAPNKILAKLSSQVKIKVHRKSVDDVLEALFPADDDRMSTTSSGSTMSPQSVSHRGSIVSQMSMTSIVETPNDHSSPTSFPNQIDEEEMPPFEVSSSPVKQVIIFKKRHESFGFTLIGGNNIGVFVEKVNNWTPADKAQIKEKWKIIKVNEHSLAGVALYYVKELINHHIREESLALTFECTSPEVYENAIKQKPYDTFHVEAIKNFTDENKKRISAGDILRVEDTSGDKWFAVRQKDGMNVSLSPIPSTFQGLKQPEYEEIPMTKEEEKSKKKMSKQNSKNDHLYKFLDNVEIELYP